MGGEELAFVTRAFETNWLSTVGPNLDAFEHEFSARLGRPAVALASGTAALHLSLRLLGVGPGDEVLCPTLTFVATVNPVRYLGAVPVLVDSESESWNMDPNLVEDAVKARRHRPPKAIVVVHLYGQTANLDPILEIAARYDIPVVEDAAPALGARYRGAPVGTFGDVAAFSFNGNKIITTTGGGMLAARDPDRVDKARFWSTQAKDPGVGYEHSELGYNYRMSNVLAGIGMGQLTVLEERVRQRRAVAERYRRAFEQLPLTLQPEPEWSAHTRWLSCFLVDPGSSCSRDALLEACAAADIEARPVWKPMHLQALYSDAPHVGGGVAEDLFRRGICLPSSSNLTEDEQGKVIETIAVAARASAR
jgi:pyridoxal phosphate-dependent aminotransferase EpsN